MAQHIFDTSNSTNSEMTCRARWQTELKTPSASVNPSIACDHNKLDKLCGGRSSINRMLALEISANIAEVPISAVAKDHAIIDTSFTFPS